MAGMETMRFCNNQAKLYGNLIGARELTSGVQVAGARFIVNSVICNPINPTWSLKTSQ